jgi:hypothetical protein
VKKPAVTVILFASISVLLTCAVKESPPGGPEDKTPPVILLVDPEPGSANIPTDTKFVITFSKSMNRQTTEDAVFLSPVFWEYPELKWSGKRLTVVPPGKLEPDRTYVLTIGADAEGHHFNKLGRSFSFAYSTGATIDSSSAKGVVFSDGSGRRTYDIWAYLLGNVDSVDFIREIPDYATQVDSMGYFAINNMGAGSYLIIAVDDKNDDLFWDPASESLGLPSIIINLVDGESFSNLTLRPARRDTTIAYISRARAMDNRKIEVELSQPILDDIYARPEHFAAVAKSDSTELEINGVFTWEEGRYIIETSLQEDGREYQLIPIGIISAWSIPFDPAGIGFVGSDEEDSSGPELMSVFPGERSAEAYQDSVVEMTFSERIRPYRFADAVTVVADSLDTLAFIPEWIAANKVTLKFHGRVPRESRIEIEIDPAMVFDISGNRMPDSSVSFGFRLPPADTVGNVIAEMGPSNRSIGILTSLKRGGPAYTTSLDEGGMLSFDAVLPGSYRFEFFEDSDGDGRWSPGVVIPFAPSERFSFLADSVDVRSRWTTDIGKVELPEQGR